MTVIDLLILIIIALVAGAIGQAIAGYSAGGFIGAIAIGFIGALLGMWIARALKLPELFAIHVGGQTFPLIWAIIGAAIFVALIRLITAPARRYYA
ncbi:MAG: GlsB/YeaQ/YmgE family stress response membrane protein [Armatimonadota bacterium]